MGMGSVAALGIGVWVFGIPLEEITSVVSDPQPRYTVALMWMNNVTQISTFLIPVLIQLVVFGRNSIHGLLMHRGSWLVALSPLVILFAGGLIDLSSTLNQLLIPEGSSVERIFKPMEEIAAHLTTMILTTDSPGHLIIAFISIAIIPSVCEELAFRGVMQPLLAKMFRNVHAAIWITAIAFSVFHMQFYGFIPRVLLGGLMGYLLIWTGSIWAPVFAHFVNNAFAFFLFRYYGSLESPDGSVQDQWYTYLITTALFVLLVALFLKNSRWPWISFEYLGITKKKEEGITPP